MQRGEINMACKKCPLLIGSRNPGFRCAYCKFTYHMRCEINVAGHHVNHALLVAQGQILAVLVCKLCERMVPANVYPDLAKEMPTHTTCGSMCSSPGIEDCTLGSLYSGTGNVNIGGGGGMGEQSTTKTNDGMKLNRRRKDLSTGNTITGVVGSRKVAVKMGCRVVGDMGIHGISGDVGCVDSITDGYKGVTFKTRKGSDLSWYYDDSRSGTPKTKQRRKRIHKNAGINKRESRDITDREDDICMSVSPLKYEAKRMSYPSTPNNINSNATSIENDDVQLNTSLSNYATVHNAGNSINQTTSTHCNSILTPSQTTNTSVLQQLYMAQESLLQFTNNKGFCGNPYMDKDNYKSSTGEEVVYRSSLQRNQKAGHTLSSKKYNIIMKGVNKFRKLKKDELTKKSETIKPKEKFVRMTSFKTPRKNEKIYKVPMNQFLDNSPHTDRHIFAH